MSYSTAHGLHLLLCFLRKPNGHSLVTEAAHRDVVPITNPGGFILAGIVAQGSATKWTCTLPPGIATLHWKGCAAMEWNERFAARGRTVRSSAIRELLKVTELPDTISFAGGLPAPELFPLALFREACIRVLGEIGPPALQYGSTEGYRPLREFVAARLRQRGMDFSADQVLITAGSQQALDLVGKLMIDPGDAVVIESPTYVGALQAFNMYGPSYLSVATDADGLHTDLLAKILRRRPKFIYVLPNFQNPSGATLSLKRRHELAEIADAFDVLIVE